ncbi:bifunctional 2-methylcitrate dehydratase/aconitate hydratase [Legionella sp. W05-934-2]|jgi:2-methylcitrate dehydratase|uniref:bifunctional 2-methylcitrate dehydratase/aconitate hydratase n=1 Tax=Legionella sp. W05-934-2 TaxID=1198649 RepID=UPI003461D45A
MSHFVEENVKPDYDAVMQSIADYVLDKTILSKEAYETARLCLMDSMGCAMLALNFKACQNMLGPIVPGATLDNGFKVPGTPYQLDPVEGAFNFGTMVRWLDFNDTWLAAEWGHPSDNLGAILAVSDYLSRQAIKQGKSPITMHQVMTAMIKAHEIQGVMALKNSFNRVGLDHVILVKLASAAVTAQLLGADRDQLLRTLSQVFVDGQSLRTYRHAPNAGSRKSWAAGDACARAVRLAIIAKRGEMGYPSALSVKTWGFYDVLFKGQTFELPQPFDSYVMENVLFKLSYPAEFHAQTAVECAVKLHQDYQHRLDEIKEIELVTHESAIRIISKQGELHNPADRDHCLQYMVAVGLAFGDLKAEHYENETANNPIIDTLRSKMTVKENKQFSDDYLDPQKRSIANSMRLHFTDGSSSELVTIEYPIGHKRRRKEGIPVLIEKFKHNLSTRFDDSKVAQLIKVCDDSTYLNQMPVNQFVDLWQQ